MTCIQGNITDWLPASECVGIVRSYSNSNIVKAVKRGFEAGLGKIIVVINKKADNGSTVAWLEEACFVQSEKLEVIELEEYSWSKALNAALRMIKINNLYLEASGRNAFKYILNFSVEVLFESDHVQKLISAFGKYLKAGVVGVRFQAKKFAKDTNDVQLGRSYNHPRNTFMCLSLERLGNFLQLFDEMCDNIGGMEDIEFILRMLVYTGLDSVMLEDIKVPLIVGAHHNQAKKEEREQSAMDKIIAHYRKIYSGMELSETGKMLKNRIEETITSMQLE